MMKRAFSKFDRLYAWTMIFLGFVTLYLKDVSFAILLFVLGFIWDYHIFKYNYEKRIPENPEERYKK